jgi:hypothetical protein
VVESTSNLDEAIVCTTLQQQRVSGDINTLFQIKVQVKNPKVNALFDNGSKCNMISKALIDDIGIQTYDLVHPNSLAWLEDKSIARMTWIHKIKFVINANYVDDVEC